MEVYGRGRALADYVGDDESEEDYVANEETARGGDDEAHSVALPPELWIDILTRAGAGAAASASQASRDLYAYGRTAAQDIGAAAKRGACRTPLSCTQALVCAIVRDDPDDLAAILLSGVVDPQLPAVPTYTSAAGAELKRLLMSEGECTAVQGPLDNPTYFFGVPSLALPGGWTPLNMAVAFRSPRSIAVLKSFGARPTTTVEPLLAEAMRSPDSPFTMVTQQEDGTLVPLPPREAPRAVMLNQLLRAFGRTMPLANVDTNPLTRARDIALTHTVENINDITSPDDPRVRLLVQPFGNADALRLAPLSGNSPNTERIRMATGVLAAQWAKVYAHLWPSIINALLEAGYSPDERTYLFLGAPDKYRDTRDMPERAAAAKALDAWIGISDEMLNAYDSAGGSAAPDAVELLNRIRRALIGTAVLRYILGLYDAVGRDAAR
nr:hypothetical protein [Pandoravirus massiliensis]